MGSDTCLKLVEIAHDRHHEVAVCNNLRLPYRDECFDAVISIGVIHHFASVKRRLRALQELGRILRPGGKMLVYVWAMEQQQRKVRVKANVNQLTADRASGVLIFHITGLMICNDTIFKTPSDLDKELSLEQPLLPLSFPPIPTSPRACSQIIKQGAFWLL